jgi:hypothetical protein
MFFGGWLYPDACSTSFAGAAVPFERDEFDCAALGAYAAQRTNTPAKRWFKAFRTGISLLRFIPQQKPIDETMSSARTSERQIFGGDIFGVVNNAQLLDDAVVAG